jgi:acyl-CoA reductase-like NAD-dependent aldehyde dehydrogenase
LLGKLELGRIAFNSGSLFDKNLPIEGWKKSGKGKILSELAYEEFSIPKSYNIKKL